MLIYFMLLSLRSLHDFLGIHGLGGNVGLVVMCIKVTMTKDGEVVRLTTSLTSSSKVEVMMIVQVLGGFFKT